MIPQHTALIPRYNAYFGSNTSMSNIAREDNEDGKWVKIKDIADAFGFTAKIEALEAEVKRLTEMLGRLGGDE